MILTYSFSLTAMGQILFAEECYKGGVMAVGINVDNGVATHHVPFHWQEHYNFRKAFVVTYRYGRPAPHTMRVNGVDVNWGNHNQVSPELPEINTLSNWSAFHVQPLDFIPDIESGILELDFPPQTIYANNINWGWSSMYLVIYYDSPEITEEVCSRLYISDKRQDMAQTYNFDRPSFLTSKPLLFSIFASRLSSFFSDRSVLELNGSNLGTIWGDDLFNTHGTQGHFYYENQDAYGLNNDTANTRLQQYDGIAIINEFINNSTYNQTLFLFYPQPRPYGRGNLHPAFVLAYTPACEMPESEVVRRHTVCHGESVELQATGYDNYAWTPGDAMNDSTLAHPVLVPDSSGWYRVSMWDEDGTACPQTIPVFVEVEDIPRPQNLEVVYSLCTDNTGRIEVSSVPGKAPWAFYLNGQYRDNGNFAGLPPGEYTLEITTALGCSWDTTLTVPVKHLQTAAFTVDPLTGYSPLEVRFRNESTGAANYRWVIDGEPVSTNTHLRYTFPDSGVYEITLMAFVGSPEAGCPDTARFTLVVLQGLEVILPNIITPNGDGMNDALTAKLSGVATLRWEVFNRWGQALHGGEASEPPSSLTLWNPGGESPDGVYTLALTAIGHSGQVTEKVVQVVLKR